LEATTTGPARLRESATISVTPMVNIEDVDFAAFLVDAVSDSILATSGAP
jgi:hypothetical protein